MTKKYAIYATGVLFLMGLWHFTGCTYRFTGADKSPFGIKRICIQMFENKTAETGIEHFFTDAVIDEFTRDGRMAISSRERADAFLSGTVKNMEIETSAHEKNYVALERRVIIGVDFVLKDTDGNVLWLGENITDRENYLVSTNKLVTEKNRREAIREISQRIAQKTFQRLAWEN